MEIKPNLIPAHQHFAILQSAIGSDKAIGGTGPRFIRFWSRSRKRLIAALALLTAAVILGYLAIHLNDQTVNIQNTTRSYNNVLKMNETVVSNVNEQNRIGTYSLILVAIIILVLLLPDIQRAKVGPVELDVRSYGPGDHGPLDDLTNKLTQKTD